MVVDASVAAKWYLLEDGSKAARNLAEDVFTLVAPNLIVTEVLAGIIKACRLNNIALADARFLCNQWLSHTREGIVQTFEDQEDRQNAISIALEAKHAFQDCLYVALASRLQIPLLTADQKQLKIAQQYGLKTQAL